VSLLELPPARRAGTKCLDALAERLGPGRVHLDETVRGDASRDHSWLSPVLTAAIPADAVADAVVRPRGADEVRTTLAVAYEHGVALTARGKGTGNYGQAVPLARGIVLDTGAVDGVIDVGEGWIHAYAGTSFTRLEAAARATGQELALFPSTTGSLLGGFLAGGAGGTGSIENGMIWDGFVDQLTLLPCWDSPETAEVDAPGALAHLHAYGTTGVMVSARVRLRPARRWTALFASFTSLGAAAAAGLALLELDTVPRNLSIDDADLATVLAAHPAMPAGRVSLRAILAEATLPYAGRAVVAAGGAVEAVLPEATSLCVSLSYNHVTLRAKRNDPSVCHLQVGGPALVAREAEVRAALPGAMVHLDAMTIGGTPGFGGLHLSRFVDRETLYAGAGRLEELGVRVIDPHSWVVGGHGPTDATVAAAVAFDPKGLLNPGKLRRAP
jgi:FAD/FMN-containing dehydrogenase